MRRRERNWHGRLPEPEKFAGEGETLTSLSNNDEKEDD